MSVSSNDTFDELYNSTGIYTLESVKEEIAQREKRVAHQSIAIYTLKEELDELKSEAKDKQEQYNQVKNMFKEDMKELQGKMDEKKN